MRTQKGRFLLVTIGTVLVLCLALCVQAKAEAITGTTGAAPQWGSGWMVLTPPMDFYKGEKLRLTVGGSAKKIVVRLLPRTQSPETSAGVIGGPVDVPSTRIVEITVPQDRKEVSQISVHGGPNPWNEYYLEGDNGAATITSVERIIPNNKSAGE